MSDTRPELGQYFTPRAVIDFAFDVLADLGARVEGASVCDPACGPGEWLDAALAAGASDVIGIDCDSAMIERWRRSGLAADPRCALVVADGLSPSLRLDQAADIVVGNPPFGADLSALCDTALTDLATHYRFAGLSRQPQLFADLPSRELDRLRRLPTEVLFLERFVRLCRPNGHIAIVLPEGIFSNRRWRHVRSWLLDEMTVDMVVGLPRATFRAHATTARTCLIVLRHRRPAPGHTVALGQVDECTPENLDALRSIISGAGHETPSLDLLPPIFSG